VQNFQVSENLRDDGNRRHGDAHRENDDQRNTVAVRACEFRTNQPGADDQAKDERNSGANNAEPSHFTALFAAEELLSFRTGKEH
jgi:hypothetical protein